MIFLNDAENKHVLLLRVYILPWKAQKAATAYFSSKQLLPFALPAVSVSPVIPCGDQCNQCVACPANTTPWTSVCLLLAHRLRRWPNIKTTVVQRLVFAGLSGVVLVVVIDSGVLNQGVGWCYAPGGGSTCTWSANYQKQLVFVPLVEDRHFGFMLAQRCANVKYLGWVWSQHWALCVALSPMTSIFKKWLWTILKSRRKSGYIWFYTIIMFV